MSGVRAWVLILSAGLAAGVARADVSAAAAWSRVRSPTVGPARSIGTYGAGCIEGAVALPKSGAGFRVVHPERQRVFGHPLLVGLIRDLGRRLAAARLGTLAVGDLGQPRGGPAPTGHASHQTGLDVDLWFALPAGKARLSMIDAANERPSPRFSDRVARLVELAASDARVDRIFIHPILKRALCERGEPEHDWLHKVRPWWGHDDHFHVRLACPPDSPACVPQPALPPGDGCDALDWWFRPSAQADREQAHASYGARVGASPELPEPCAALVSTQP